MLVDCWIFLLKPLFLTYIYIFFLYIPHTLFHVLSTFSILSFPLFVWYQQKAEETDLSFQLFLPSLLLLFTYPFFLLFFIFYHDFFYIWLTDMSPQRCVFPSYITAATFFKKWPMRYLYLYLISMTDDWYIHGIARLKLALTLFFFRGVWWRHFSPMSTTLATSPPDSEWFQSNSVHFVWVVENAKVRPIGHQLDGSLIAHIMTS